MKRMMVSPFLFWVVIPAALALLTAKTEAAPALGANYVCAQMFSADAFRPVAQARMARGVEATGVGTRIALNEVMYAQLQPNGFFGVYDASTENKIFISTPTPLKRLIPFTRRSDVRMIPVSSRPMPRLLMPDGSREYLVHSTGDLTKLDVWKVPFDRAAQPIDVAEALVGRTEWRRHLTPGYSDVTSEFGFVERRNERGYYTSSFEISSNLNIGATAFFAPENRSGVIYAMYEVLTGWTGMFNHGEQVPGAYRYQKIVLLEIDLRQSTAKALGEFRGAPLATASNDGEFSFAAFPEADRFTSFVLMQNESGTALQVVGHASSGSPEAGTSQVLIQAPL